MNLAKYAKAVIAFVAPGAVLLITGATDGLTTTELLIAALTCVTTAAAVWGTPNKAAPDQSTPTAAGDL